MAELHEKMYAYLVGEVDDALEMIANNLVDGECGRDELIAVGHKLKNALLGAEEMYLEAEETEENETSFAEDVLEGRGIPQGMSEGAKMLCQIWQMRSEKEAEDVLNLAAALLNDLNRTGEGPLAEKRQETSSPPDEAGEGPQKLSLSAAPCGQEPPTREESGALSAQAGTCRA